MEQSIKDYTKRLRNRTRFWLVNNESEFFQYSYNPFDRNRVPLMCDFIDSGGFTPLEAYESGNRSILFMHDGWWFKAKGIGIPTGVSRPIYDKGKIYTYKIYDDPNTAHESILWGFLHKTEYDCEKYGATRAKELGQRIELLGTTSFKDVYYLMFKDRGELFKNLYNTKQKTLIKSFKREGVLTTAYSIYYKVPSDLRVIELFFTFMFPIITKFIDPKLIKEYVGWIGSSCANLLRQFHESGALHGTWIGNRPTSLGMRDIHSNSYIGNFLIDEEGLAMCDFDLSKPVENEFEKEMERWALIHVENPLYYAGSYSSINGLNMKTCRKNPFREELVALFEQSVNIGYKGDTIEIENSIKREMLGIVVRAKELIWKLYGLPKEVIGHISYLDYLISKKNISHNALREAVDSFG